MTELTEEHKKELTLYLEECWHEVASQYMTQGNGWLCRHCRKTFTVNRTFTTDGDLHAVYSMMEEKGEWEQYHDEARNILRGDYVTVTSRSMEAAFNAWLFCLNTPQDIPVRMVMAAEFVEGRK